MKRFSVMRIALGAIMLSIAGAIAAYRYICFSARDDKTDAGNSAERLSAELKDLLGYLARSFSFGR